VTDENLNSLETQSLAYSVLTMQEAMVSFQTGEESEMLHVKINQDTDSPINRIIRIRKSDVILDGEMKIIVTIRDLTDSFNFEKMQLQQKDE